MFKQSPTRQGSINLVYGLFARYKRGESIPHIEMVNLVGCSPPEPKYYAILRRARRRFFRDTGIFIREVPTFGVELCTEDQQVMEVDPRIERMRQKRLRLQIALLKTAAEGGGISAKARQIATFREDALRREAAEARDRNRQLNLLMNPTRTNPKMLPFDRQA